MIHRQSVFRRLWNNNKEGLPTPARKGQLVISVIVAGFVFGFAPVLAQSARDLGLAGVTMPDEGAMFSNPALAHRDFSTRAVVVPVPFGLFGLVSNLSGEDLDVLYLLDAALHPESYLLNPASGDIDVAFEAGLDEDGRPELSLDIDTGDLSGFLRSLSRGVEQSLDLPVAFRIGGQTFAVHPFERSYVQFKPTGGFGKTVSVGLDTVRLNLTAGVSADWLYTRELAVSPNHPPGAKRYVGVRTAPFVGLVNIDADIDSSDLEVNVGEFEASFRLDASSFSSIVSVNGAGGGLTTDWGLVDVLPLPLEPGRGSREVVLGVSVQDLSLSYWRGRETDLVGEGSSEAPDEVTLEFQERAASRFFFAPHLNVLVHGAYRRDFSNANSLTVAADLELDAFTGAPSTALGVEGVLHTALVENLSLRSGVGWEGGLKWGLGAGANWGWFGLDTAFHAYRSPASLRSTYGLAVSTDFRF